MDVINVQKEMFDEVKVLEFLALFTKLRVDKNTVPEGVYCYALRHGDDDRFPVALEKDVYVNYFGSVLMAEKLKFDKEQSLSVGLDNFWYTGAEMKLEEFIAKSKENTVPKYFQNGKALALFSKEIFPITDAEGDKLLGYLKEHQYLLGEKDGVLYRGEQNKECDEVRWEPYVIEDVINDACEYNFDEILQLTQELMDCKDTKECEQISDRLNQLCTDEALLDKLFDRTRYGKEIEELAHILAEELIRDMESKGSIDDAVQKMTEALKKGEELLPDVSPQLKQNKGRSR